MIEWLLMIVVLLIVVEGMFLSFATNIKDIGLGILHRTYCIASCRHTNISGVPRRGPQGSNSSTRGPGSEVGTRVH